MTDHLSTGTAEPSPEAAGHEQELSMRETLRILLAASRGFWLVNWVNFGDGVA